MIAYLPSCYSPSFLWDLSLLWHGWRVAASLPPLWPANGTTRHSYLQGTLLGSVPDPYRKLPTSCWLYCPHSRPHPHHYLPPRRMDRDPNWSPVFSPTFPFSFLQSPLSKVIRSLSCSATSDVPPPSAGKSKSIMWPVLQSRCPGAPLVSVLSSLGTEPHPHCPFQVLCHPEHPPLLVLLMPISLSDLSREESFLLMAPGLLAWCSSHLYALLHRPSSPLDGSGIKQPRVWLSSWGPAS